MRASHRACRVRLPTTPAALSGGRPFVRGLWTRFRLRARAGGFYGRELRGGIRMLAVIVVLLLAAVLFGIGFTAHLLWIVAAIVLALWLIGFVARAGSGARW